MNRNYLAAVLLLLAHVSAGAVTWQPRDLEVRVAENGRLTVSFQGAVGACYRLLRSDTLGGEGRPVAVALGTGGRMEMADSLMVTRNAYFRVETNAAGLAPDSDGDFLSDAEELELGPMWNPLNPARMIDFADGATRIPDRATYEALAHRDNFPGAVNVREVKFLIRGVDGPKPELYFLNTKNRIYHYDFAREVLGYAANLDYWTGLPQFNDTTYFTNTHRTFIAGSLIAYETFQLPGAGRPPGLYGIEFWPTDPVSHTFVRKAVELVAAAMPFVPNGLAYHPSGETQRALFRSESSEWAASPVPVVQSEELFSNVSYAMLNPGVTFGRLRIVQGTDTLSIRDLPIFSVLPNTLTHVAGIITSVPQTPLSHINLKAKQNGTPNCYVLNAETDPRLVPLLGSFVRLEVGPDGFDIRAATQVEVDEHFEAIRPTTPQYPPRDLTRQTIVPTTQIAFAQSTAFGAKAANVAEMRRWLPAGMVPTGHAVPFYFYDEFMKANGLYDLARAIMQETWFIQDPAVRESRLDDFRMILKKAPVPAWMETAFASVQAAYPAGTSLRCRSSTNNEDLPGFNGAGLYDSYTHHPDEGSLSKSIRQVWASLWNYRAFEERDFYRVDHFTAAMGVLIYPNFDDELANGVAVSKNVFDPSWRGYYVNSQVGESLITNPDPNAVPEEFLIAALLGAERYEIQYARFSSLLPEGQTVLTKAQAFQLADTLATIHSRFRSLYLKTADPTFAMEIEFKIDTAGKLIVKQARPWVE